MKRIIFLLLTILSCSIVFAQNADVRGKRVTADSVLKIPLDTLRPATNGSIAYKNGGLYYKFNYWRSLPTTRDIFGIDDASSAVNRIFNTNGNEFLFKNGTDTLFIVSPGGISYTLFNNPAVFRDGISVGDYGHSEATISFEAGGGVHDVQLSAHNATGDYHLYLPNIVPYAGGDGIATLVSRVNTTISDNSGTVKIQLVDSFRLSNDTIYYREWYTNGVSAIRNFKLPSGSTSTLQAVFATESNEAQMTADDNTIRITPHGSNGVAKYFRMGHVSDDDVSIYVTNNGTGRGEFGLFAFDSSLSNQHEIFSDHANKRLTFRSLRATVAAVNTFYMYGDSSVFTTTGTGIRGDYRFKKTDHSGNAADVMVVLDSMTGKMAHRPLPTSNSGTVTSVAAGYGTTFTTITSTGSVIVDSSVIATKGTTQVWSGQKIFTSGLNFGGVGSGNVKLIDNGASLAVMAGDGSGYGTATMSSLISGATTFNNANTNATIVNAFGAATTGTIFGTPTGAVTHNYSTNATLTATTKTVNIATGGASGSTTALTFGSNTSGATNHVKVNITPASDAEGDIFYRHSSGYLERLAIGDAGHALYSTGSIPEWRPTSGFYDPSFSNATNTDGVSPYTLRWSRTGDQVTVSGKVVVDPTANSTLTSFEIQLPITDANFESDLLAGGAGFSIDTPGAGFGVFSTNGSNTVTAQFISTTTSAITFTFTFSYTVFHG